MRYFVTPTQEKQIKLWEKIYGRSHLPVKYPSPHLACTQRWGEALVYYLDVTAVPAALLDRLAVYEARRMGVSYAEARQAVRHEWLIRAEGCRLETDTPQTITPWQPAFSFLQKVPLGIRPRARQSQPAF